MQLSEPGRLRVTRMICGVGNVSRVWVETRGSGCLGEKGIWGWDWGGGIAVGCC